MSYDAQLTLFSAGGPQDGAWAPHLTLIAIPLLSEVRAGPSSKASCVRVQVRNPPFCASCAPLQREYAVRTTVDVFTRMPCPCGSLVIPFTLVDTCGVPRMAQILEPGTGPRTRRVTFAGGFSKWQDFANIRTTVPSFSR